MWVCGLVWSVEMGKGGAYITRSEFQTKMMKSDGVLEMKS